MKIQYQLNGLICGGFVIQIEEKLLLLPEVETVGVDYLNKKVALTLVSGTKLNDFKGKVSQIVKDIDPELSIVDKGNVPIKLNIEGLNCEICASKIEETLRHTEGFKDVSLNLLSSTLKFNTQPGYLEDALISQAKVIVDQIEPGTTLSSNENEEPVGHTYSALYPIFIATVFFIIGFIIGESHFLYLPIMLMSYLIVGGKIVLRALKNIMGKNFFDEHFLMTIATLGAFGIGEYAEAVAVMLFYQVGEYFQERAVNRSRTSIKSLLSIKPEVANVIVLDDIITKKVGDVLIGELIIIKPGERIPLDSIVVKGDASVDTKTLTGESLPITASIGDTILSGCINLDGVLTARVIKISSESTVNKILELVENAASKKAQTEKLITKFAKYYTPIVTVAALLLAILPPLLIPGETFTVWLSRAFIFLVISCPCALVISIPLSFFAGIGFASKQGILVKGGNYLEALNQVKIAVFDKTGTLTKGSFLVTNVEIADKTITEIELLKMAATIESFSNHPIAKSILKAYGKKIDQNEVTNIQEISGHGLSAMYENKQILIGNSRLMEKHEITYQKTTVVGSALYLAIDGLYVGNIVVQDEIKQDAKQTISELKKLGIVKTVMLTGDKREVAHTMGHIIGIDEIHAELLPENKLSVLEKYIGNKKEAVLYVGDGINDTPVLKRADVGIAMGGLGSDAAIEMSDIVIMNDEPSRIVTAFKIARYTRKIVWQNIVFALGVKILFLTLGALGHATMFQAVFADVGVSILAILNAFRIYKTKSNV